MKWFSQFSVTNADAGKKKSASDVISERQKFRMREDLKTLRDAVDQADNMTLHNREDLHRIYREVYKDPHIKSQWCTRKLKTIEKEFAVVSETDNTVVNDELTSILESQWFMDLMDEILESKMWGFRLIEFGPVDKEGKRLMPYRSKNNRLFNAVNAVDPDYVKPEWGYIGAEPSSQLGVPFIGGPFDNQLLFVGKHHDYGLMESAVKYILFKNNCIENWSEWAEVFGMDMRVGKTDAEGENKKKFLNMLRDIGSSGYGVIDKEDTVEHFGTARTDAYKVYEALMDTVDKNVSKLIFGQDVVTNNTGRVIGEVGENVSNLYGDSDAKFVARVINKEVFPKLEALGLASFKGFKFKWDTTEKISLKDQAEIDYKISQTGWRPAKAYLEEKYACKLEEMPEPKVTGPTGAAKGKTAKVNNALRELYADSVE